jgi:hypothetical protein
MADPLLGKANIDSNTTLEECKILTLYDQVRFSPVGAIALCCSSSGASATIASTP